MNWFKSDHARSYVLMLYIQPGAKRTEAIGMHGNALKIKLAAAPIEGKANAALVKYLAECFKVPQNQVVLKQGERSRWKIVKILHSKYSPDALFLF